MIDITKYIIAYKNSKDSNVEIKDVDLYLKELFAKKLFCSLFRYR